MGQLTFARVKWGPIVDKLDQLTIHVHNLIIPLIDAFVDDGSSSVGAGRDCRNSGSRK
jgi:hypothetical protein